MKLVPEHLGASVYPALDRWRSLGDQMPQSKVESLMQSYVALTAAERQEFQAMLTGYNLSRQSAQGAGKKAAATRKNAQPKATGEAV